MTVQQPEYRWHTVPGSSKSAYTEVGKDEWVAWTEDMSIGHRAFVTNPDGPAYHVGTFTARKMAEDFITDYIAKAK